MKTITITEFELSKPKESDYNWNSDFKQSFETHPYIYLIKFEIPNDYFWPEYRRFSIRLAGNIKSVFNEFNKLFQGRTSFQTIILLNEPHIDSVDFYYFTKQYRIDQIQMQIDGLIAEQKELMK